MFWFLVFCGKSNNLMSSVAHDFLSELNEKKIIIMKHVLMAFIFSRYFVDSPALN